VLWLLCDVSVTSFVWQWSVWQRLVLAGGSRFSGSRRAARWRRPLTKHRCSRRSKSLASWRTVDIYAQRVVDAACRDAVCVAADQRRRVANCPPADVVLAGWIRRTSVARRLSGTRCSGRQFVVLETRTLRHDLTAAAQTRYVIAHVTNYLQSVQISE